MLGKKGKPWAPSTTKQNTNVINQLFKSGLSKSKIAKRLCIDRASARTIIQESSKETCNDD
jgi:DNA invertase Pin-like site-specific DNA recombinase